MRPLLAGLALLLLTGCGSGDRPADPPPADGLSLPPLPSATAPATAVAAGALRLGADWTTYHGDVSRSGYLASGPDPQQPSVAWQARLDGKVYASPLVVGGRVLAATEGGSLYALDGPTGRVLWRRHLADPISADRLPCGNIDPIGITGTPVYDPATRQVFAVTTEAGPRHVLHAVDVATGAVRSRRPVDAPGSQPATQLQRGALLLSGGAVLIPYGGNYGDCGQYLGRVVSARVAGGPLRAFSVPTAREAGIWSASGPAATPEGEVLVTTGNGAASGGPWDSSDSVLRLSPDLRLLDGFAPQGWAQENSVDADLGSTGPLLLPGGRQVVAAGKGGSAYLLDVGHLGGVGGQTATVRDCSSYGGGAAVPVRGGGAAVYLPCQQGLLQLRVEGRRLLRGWQAPEQVTGSPVVVGTTVWSVQQDGALYGLDAATGRQRARLQVGDATRFASPAASGNALLVPTQKGITAVRLR